MRAVYSFYGLWGCYAGFIQFFLSQGFCKLVYVLWGSKSLCFFCRLMWTLISKLLCWRVLLWDSVLLQLLYNGKISFKVQGLGEGRGMFISRGYCSYSGPCIVVLWLVGSGLGSRIDGSGLGFRVCGLGDPRACFMWGMRSWDQARWEIGAGKTWNWRFRGLANLNPYPRPKPKVR